MTESITEWAANNNNLDKLFELIFDKTKNTDEKIKEFTEFAHDTELPVSNDPRNMEILNRMISEPNSNETGSLYNRYLNTIFKSSLSENTTPSEEEIDHALEGPVKLGRLLESDTTRSVVVDILKSCSILFTNVKEITVPDTFEKRHFSSDTDSDI